MVQARAVVIDGKGDVDVLRIGEIEVREPGPGELLVEVAAAGLNRADTLQRRGFYPAPPGVAAMVPGLEYAGSVARIGTGVTEFAPGDRVMGIIAGGGMATHVVVHAREALRVPAGMSLTDAAAIPEVFLTAYDALFPQAELGLGKTCWCTRSAAASAPRRCSSRWPRARGRSARRAARTSSSAARRSA